MRHTGAEDRVARTGRRAALWLGTALFLAACVACASAELAEVYLKNGLKLRGEVTVTESEVIVRNELGEARFPKAEVERITAIRPEAAGPATRPATRPATQADTQPTTMSAERRPQPEGPSSAPTQPAGAEPPGGRDARTPRPSPVLSALDIQRLKMSELRLDGPAEKLRVRFAENPAELSQRILWELNARQDFRREWEDILLRGQPHDKLQLIVATTGTKYAGRISIVDDPEVFQAFRTQVLPTVVKSCAQSGCHSGPEAVALRFPDGPTRAEAYVYTSFVLLERMQAQHKPLIDRDDPEGSVLLDYLLPDKDNPWAHPPVTKRRLTPAFRGRDNATYRRIVGWINSLRTPRPDYGLDYVFPPWMTAPAAERLETRAAPGEPASAPASQPARPP